MRCTRFPVKVSAVAFIWIFYASAIAQVVSPAATIERGRHLVLIGHCNNCHTAGYMASAGKVPEARWLMGNPVGWRSKQGTTYAPNLRRFVQNLSEENWIQVVRAVQWRPPMPWWSMRDHTEEELRAMYHFIRSLTPVGQPAPSFLPPGQVPSRPYQQLPDMS